MKSSDQKLLSNLRSEFLQKVIIRLEKKPAITIKADNDFNKYTYSDQENTVISIPEKSGVYAFYSQRTNMPVYVGESLSLKNRIKQHCRISGSSVFKSNWITHWLGASASIKEAVSFIHSRMYFKYIIVPFGRKEIETDLREFWRLSSPQTVDKDIF